jgi:zinc D-Ala-D-Ala carboxypeptidase
MPLPRSTALSTHFTAGELGADDPAVTPAILANLQQLVVPWLENARAELGGVPLIVTRGFSTPAHNAAVGGSPTSDHPDGLAADFKASGLTPFQVYQRLTAARAAGRLAPFDQLIYYETDDHVHVGLGARLRGEVLLRTREGSYIELVSRALSLIRGWV